jgi:hypothetical protein
VGILGPFRSCSSQFEFNIDDRTASTPVLVPAGNICPANNGTIVVTSNGASFLVQCGFDSVGGDLFSVRSVDLAYCLETCSTTAKCVQVSLASSTCYLKSSSRSGFKRSWIQGRRLVNVAPASSTLSSQDSIASLVMQTTSSISTSTSIPTISALVTSSVATSSSLSSASSTSVACDGDGFDLRVPVQAPARARLHHPAQQPHPCPRFPQMV